MDARSASAEPISDEDYLAIEAALIATEKGRAFLAEYTVRNRTADTHRLMRSITRLHRATIGHRGFEDALRRDMETILQRLRTMRTALPIEETGAKGGWSHDLGQIEASVIALSEELQDRSAQQFADTGGYGLNFAIGLEAKTV